MDVRCMYGWINGKKKHYWKLTVMIKWIVCIIKKIGPLTLARKFQLDIAGHITLRLAMWPVHWIKADCIQASASCVDGFCSGGAGSTRESSEALGRDSLAHHRGRRFTDELGQPEWFWVIELKSTNDFLHCLSSLNDDNNFHKNILRDILVLFYMSYFSFNKNIMLMSWQFNTEAF